MRCIITGHTTGIGKELFAHFKNLGWDVVGISRTTGINLETDLETVVSLSTGCDLFINNTYCNDAQIKLVTSLHNRVKKMVVMGSIASDYAEKFGQYGKNKAELERVCKTLNQQQDTNILYLKITMLEDATSTDSPVKYSEVIDTIMWGIKNNSVTQIDFGLKATEKTKRLIKEKFNISL